MRKTAYCYQCKYYRPGIQVPSSAYCSSSKSDFFQNNIAEHFICRAFVRAGKKAPGWMLLLNRFLSWLSENKKRRAEIKHIDEVIKRGTGGGSIMGDGFTCLIYFLTFLFLSIYVILEFIVVKK